MSWRWEIVERDHDIQNPTSPEKIKLLGSYLRLGAGSRVLDIACGKCGPAIILASTYGCHIVGIEKRPEFADEARARIRDRSLEGLVEVRTADAAQEPIESEAWDAATCLGAAFVWGNIGDAARALVGAVRSGGRVAIGEPFWLQWPLRAGHDPQDFVELASTVDRFESSGLAMTGMIAASQNDWDHYESLHWRAVEEWVADHPEETEMWDLHRRYMSEYLTFERDFLGWAIFVGLKR